MTRFVKIFLASLFLCTSVQADSGEKPSDTDDTVTVHMQTSKGEIVLELNKEKAPLTVANFIEYANSGFYDGTVFHRVIPGFMIQGGGFEPGMTKKPTRAPVKNESKNGLRNTTGTIAMARLPNPDSATAQFFINTNNNRGLNYPSQGGYTVFGKVVKGMSVVRAIEKTLRGSREIVIDGGRRVKFSDVPVEDIIIEKVTVEQPQPTTTQTKP